MRAMGCLVPSCAFDPFPYAPWRSSGSFRWVRSIPVRPRDCQVRSCAAIFWFVGMRSGAPFVRFIPVRLGFGRVRSGAFGRFPCALRVPGGLRLRSVTFVTFPCALGVVWCSASIPLCPVARRVSLCPVHSVRVVVFVRMRSVHSRAPSGSSGSIVCVRSIPVRPVSLRFRSCVFGPFLFAVGFVQVLLSSGTFGYIPVRTGCRRVRSVYSRASWGPSGSVQSIPVHPGGCLLCLGAFGTFPCAQGVVLFVCVCPFSYAV